MRMDALRAMSLKTGSRLKKNSKAPESSNWNNC